MVGIPGPPGPPGPPGLDGNMLSSKKHRVFKFNQVFVKWHLCSHNSSFLFFIQLGIRPLLGHKGLLVLQVSLAHKVHLARQAIEMTSVQTSESTSKVRQNIYYNRNSSKSLSFLCNHQHLLTVLSKVFPSEAHQVPLVLLGLRVPLVKSMDWFHMQSMASERGSKQNNKNLSKVSFEVQFV